MEYTTCMSLMVAHCDNQVLRVAQALDTSVQLTTCGSYRRGKSDCGDIDILCMCMYMCSSCSPFSSFPTPSDACSCIVIVSQVRPSNGFLKQLVDHLHSLGIITDHLTSSVVDKFV